MGKISSYSAATAPLVSGDIVPFDVGGTTTKKATVDQINGVLDQNAAAGNSVTTTTGSDLTLATITVPANALAANGRIEIECDFSYTNSSNVKTLKIKFGGSTLWSATPTTTTGLAVRFAISNRNATNSQRWSAQHFLSSGTVGVSNGTAAIDTTSAVTILVTGQLALGSETITLEARRARIYAKA